MELKDCFKEDFTTWLLSPFQINNLSDLSKELSEQVEKESLQEILDVLLREPLANYFWYSYKDGKLLYSVPSNVTYKSFASIYLDTSRVVVPGHAIRVDEQKVKIFLRDYKLQTLGI